MNLAWDGRLCGGCCQAGALILPPSQHCPAFRYTHYSLLVMHALLWWWWLRWVEGCREMLSCSGTPCVHTVVCCNHHRLT